MTRVPIPLRLGLLSLAVGLLACATLVAVAQRQGLDPLGVMGDAVGYRYLAENLAERGVFSVAQEEPYYPESFRTPGYPFFLAALYTLFGNWYVVLFFQAALVSMAPVLLYLLVRPYHQRAALWSALLFIFEPVRLFVSSSFLSDSFFVCLSLGALLMLDRSRGKIEWLWWAGLALGAAILVRPIAMFLPLLFVVYVLWDSEPWRARLARAGVLLAAALLVVLPWMLRNHALFGTYQLSSVGAVNLMIYNAPEFLRFAPDARGEALVALFMERQRALPQDEELSLARADEFTGAFREVIQGRELQYAAFHVYKTIPFFVSDGLRDIVRLFGVPMQMPNITDALAAGDAGRIVSYVAGGGVAAWLLILGSGFWGAVTALWAACVGGLIWRGQYRLAFCVAALVLYFALLTGPVSNARYRLPAEGFMLAAAAAMLMRRDT